MTESLQNLLALNIVLLGTVVASLTLMILWSRMTRGVWPGRSKLILLCGLNLSIWVGANIMYLYLRAR